MKKYVWLSFVLLGCSDPVEPEPKPWEPATIVTYAGANSDFAGAADGPLAASRFDMPEGMLIDRARNLMYVADSNNHTIRQIDLVAETVTTIAGVPRERGSNDTTMAGGAVVPARLSLPRNLVLAPDGGSLYFTDTSNYIIRKLDLATRAVTTEYGDRGTPGIDDGVGTAARFGQGAFFPWGGGLVIDASAPAAPVMYVADSANQTIRAIDLVTDQVTTIAGRALVAGAMDGPAAMATFNKPAGLALVGRRLYIAEANNLDLRVLDLDAMTVSTVAGKAPADPGTFCENVSPRLPPECEATDAANGRDARFRFPFGVDLDGAGGLLIADSHNNLIRRVDLATTAVTTVAGTQSTVLDDFPRASVDSSATEVGTLSHPSHVVALDATTMFVSDRSANCIRKVTRNPAPRPDE